MNNKLFLVIFLVACTWPMAQANVWGQVAALAIKQVLGLFTSGEINIVNHQCLYRSRPSFARFRARHKGKVWCPGWTTIEGRSRTKSRKGAVEHAVRDFVNKAANAGVLKRGPELTKWLQKYNG